MVPVFRLTVFFALITSVFAGERLNALVTAAQDFSVAIQEQLAAVQSDISATQLVEKMVTYAKAKIAYFNALRAEMPEMIDIATGRQPRPTDLDKFPAMFTVAGEKQEKTADEKTLALLHRFSGKPGVEEARAEFGKAQDVEGRFHHDFDEVDFTMRQGRALGEYCLRFEPPPACRRSMSRHRPECRRWKPRARLTL
jgi:hypothetical protein